MEKNQKRTVREVSATPGRSSSDQRTFAKPKFQFGEEDSSWLIGGVVEKGVVEKPMEMTKAPSAPVPTVLPFPVARHRAHGPVSVSIKFELNCLVVFLLLFEV